MKIKYTQDNEWLRIEDGVITVGITDFAQEQLGDLVFVQLPEVGAKVAAGEEVAVIESVKAASGINMPVNGEIVAINTTLADEPGQVNQDPMEAGWFFKMKADDVTQLESFLEEAAYLAQIGK